MPPTLRPERAFARRCGGVLVAGIDEAGRGPLAGPVVAAAVIFAPDKTRPRGLDDSKQLSAKKREGLYERIRESALTCAVGITTAQEIDMMNILEATLLAARRALEQLSPQPGALITDALSFANERRPVLPLVKGDTLSASIAAASILAKVTRDRMMDAYAREFPEYGWEHNRGYPTPEHYAAIEAHGPTTLHRMTFAGVGFFSESLRRSRTHADFVRRLRQEPAESLQAELNALAERLPPPDLEDLRRRLKDCATGAS